MNTTLKIAVGQRVDLWTDRGERRDALDQRWCQWLWMAGCVAVPVPNGLPTQENGLQRWLQAVEPDGMLLSGGNDVGVIPERDCTEAHLLTCAAARRLPVLGICRGMQGMAAWAGGHLHSVTGHVRTRHRLQTAKNGGQWPDEVNSYHNFALADCPTGFVVAAWSENEVIEAIRHKNLPWEGWMWHPEREQVFNTNDISRFRALLGSRNTH